jgi:hypothetical protein
LSRERQVTVSPGSLMTLLSSRMVWSRLVKRLPRAADYQRKNGQARRSALH